MQPLGPDVTEQKRLNEAHEREELEDRLVREQVGGKRKG
jgi:hypothetical protein